MFRYTALQSVHAANGTYVRRLAPDDAAAYRAMMLQAYGNHPDAFTSSVAERESLPLTWWAQRLSRDDDAREVVYGVFCNGVLAGAAGLSVEAREKARHKSTLFGMVVDQAYRGRGLGRLLVQAVLDHAESLPQLRVVQLTVTQGNASAQALYQGMGFVEFGVEPMAVSTGATYLAKVHMWRELKANES